MLKNKINDICIVGDSYADINGDSENISWPNLLSKQVESHYTIDSQSGISNWAIYERFCNAVDSKKFTHAIFCHTNPCRWPCLPKELEGSNWNIHADEVSVQDVDSYKLLQTMSKYYFDLFPGKFTQFICESIFKEVNQYCKENGIYLINIMCFNTPYSCETDFPILHDIDRISHYEKILHNNKHYTMREFGTKKLPNGDPRICHFGSKNNTRMANILQDWLVNKPMNITMNAFNDFEWDMYDESNDKMFSNHLMR